MWQVDRLDRIKLQIGGFVLMAVALTLLSIADGLPGGGEKHLALVMLGFALFNTFMNAGPNATTYALPAEIFPSEVRPAGHGFAAGCAKLGAALGVFLFPILIDDIGASALLAILAGVCLLGALVTIAFRMEPLGRSLDELGGHEVAAFAPRVTPP